MTVDLPVIDFTSFPMPRGPWVRGDAVTVEELTSDAGWSLYRLPGGSTVVLSPSVDRAASGMLALIALWRTVANLIRICPACGARGALDPGTYRGKHVDVLMRHENRCVLSDSAIEASWDDLAESGALPADLPSAPRQWTVCPPRLAIRPKRRRRHRR